jgi:hypothetical protein
VSGQKITIGPPQPSPEFCSIVILGMMNPAIHHPSWYQSVKLIDEQERDSAVAGQIVIMQQVSQFSTSDFSIICVPDRWEIQSRKFASMDRILALASRVFEILDHTPVGAFGYNFHFHRETLSRSVGNLLGRAIKELPLGLRGVGDAEGQVILTSSAENQKRTVTIAQSPLGTNRLFMGFNYHYDLMGVRPPGAHFDLTPVLTKPFKPDFEQSETLGKAILEAFAETGGVDGSGN